MCPRGRGLAVVTRTRSLPSSTTHLLGHSVVGMFERVSQNVRRICAKQTRGHLGERAKRMSTLPVRNGQCCNRCTGAWPPFPFPTRALRRVCLEHGCSERR
eukprot:363926-Chlamydomonas_euryale.AAC.10